MDKFLEITNKETYDKLLRKNITLEKLSSNAWTHASNHSWAQQVTHNQTPKEDKQYAVETSQSTTAVTTLWDKQSYLYFKIVHVCPRLNAVNVVWCSCIVNIHYIKGDHRHILRNGQQKHIQTVTCWRSSEISDLCFLWVQDWMQVHLNFFWFVV